MNKNIILVIILVIAVGGGAFFGGMKYDQSKQAKVSSANGSGFQGRQGQGTGQRGMRTGGGFTSGQIIAADDKSITVKSSDSGSKIIFLSDATQISKFAAGQKSDLAVGMNVMASGKTNTDGSVTADTIQIRPEIAGQPGGQPQSNQTPQNTLMHPTPGDVPSGN